ncbi:MAG: DUF2723 domain-containing protein [Bacteroidales bacterium]|nr:DUF2723 domain-containing protein [Bacteroidales bacterium]HRX32182.1 DUF2723 domain-containing protein [Tenuifilaceae bacterium]
MSTFRKLNNIVGWIVFAIAASVYLLTIEPSASFWDCGEFIATAFKLEVGHPPGAPLFVMIARLFGLFASDVTTVAKMVNSMSALASGFTILFLFWTITHFARKIFERQGKELTSGRMIAILASGVVGALAYAFSDTFWFSAVEGEVYGMSSFFTAIVFWAILKWEDVADSPYANRWLIFIAYMMGLSIGVHLLNLLTIPAIAFVYYFRKYKPTRNGVILTLLVSGVILGAILYVIIPGIFALAGVFELLFVNGFGLPFHSGLFFYIIALVAAIIYLIYLTHKKRKVLLNTVFVALSVILIGYSSYALIIIRANVNTPIDENKPSNVFALINYLNREQYGDRPLLYGQYYNAPVKGSYDAKTWIPKNGKYVETYLKTEYNFDDQFKTVFPRMWSPQQDHISEYKKWADVKGNPVKVQNNRGESETRYVPTFGENLKFFFRYQIGFMYMRYFMWNFVGRQDDVQSHGGVENGNWISGIKPIDAIFLGNQDELTDEQLNHPSRNTYFFLPLILGLIGIFYQLSEKRDRKNLLVIFMLFFLTGVAIVVYLNQYPLQPRERDYAYAGSFYAYTIWIGLGVLGIYEWLSKIMSKTPAAVTAGIVCMCVPVVMGQQNWDDHDRSGRYTTRDFAKDYLNSCAPNAILFTNGDNDTFPLWYAQEVEGVRTDVRVVNLSLLGTDWYIDQMKDKCYQSAPLPLTMTNDQYIQGTRDIVYIYNRINEPVELKSLMNFVLSDDKATKLPVPGESSLDYFPSNKVKLAVDKRAVLENHTVRTSDSSLIVPEMQWQLKGEYLTKSALAMLDIIANNNWKRPIYFVSPYGDSDIGIEDYLQLDGFTYRFIPIKSKSKDFLSVGRIDDDTLYNNLMNKFSWGRMNAPDVFIDYNNQRTAMVLKLRNTFSRLADDLIAAGKKDSAQKVLDKIVDLMPQKKYPYDIFMFSIIEGYYKLNETQKANDIVEKYINVTVQKIRYYISLGDKFVGVNDYDLQVAFQTLQQLSSVADAYGQKEVAEKANTAFNELLRKLRPGE